MIGPRILDPASRAVVAISAIAAVAAEAALGGRAWSPLLPLTLAILVGSAVVARLFPRGFWPVSLAATYLVPLFFIVQVGIFQTGFNSLWLAALLGGVVGDRGWRGWAFPSRWRIPLAYWALVVALVWPIVVWRETDFTLALLNVEHLANSGLGGPPAVIAVWVLNVALTHMVGLLWFDWMFSALPFGDGAAFRRRVVIPLGISIIAGSLLAAYQATVDLSFLSFGPWANAKRAAGSLLDGDAFGALAGFWSAAFLALIGPLGVTGILFGGLGFIATWAGLWATGSRSALLAGGIGLAAAAWSAIRVSRWSRGSLVRWVAVAVVCVGVAAGLQKVNWSHNDALSRLMETRPEMSWPAVRQYAEHNFWNRFGPFGTVSVQMVREHPALGVGLGSFHHLFTDFAFRLQGQRFFPENAQSWYRHHLAELGIVGSLGWLWWCGSFIWLLTRRSQAIGRTFAPGTLKGTLMAVGVVSAIAMPTQNAAVSLSVWMFAFWYLQLAPAAQEWISRPAAPRTRAWAGVWGTALVYGAATLWIGWTELRPPYRAIRADWRYVNGFYDMDMRADGQAFRWTGARAIDVFPIEGRWLKLRIGGGPPDAASRPSRVQVWRRQRLIVDVIRRATDDQTWYVEAPPASEKRMMIEIHVSRTWRLAASADLGDSRELGVAVDAWSFVGRPPADARVVPYVR